MNETRSYTSCFYQCLFRYVLPDVHIGFLERAVESHADSLGQSKQGYTAGYRL